MKFTSGSSDFIKGMSVVFFWVHGEWIGVWDKKIVWTVRSGSQVICLFPAPIHSPWTQKKTLIPYIYKASNKDPF